MKFLDILLYFVLTCTATAFGVCYTMALETMRRKNFKPLWVYILSVLLTPFGAWVIATAVRAAEQPAPVEPEPAEHT